MATFAKWLMCLLFSVGLAAQPAGPIPTADPVPASGATFTLQNTAQPPANVGDCKQSNTDIWDLTPPSGPSTVLHRQALPTNSDYSGDCWVELGGDGAATGYPYVFFKNWEGKWRWEKRACTVNSSNKVLTVGSSAGYGPLSGVT